MMTEPTTPSEHLERQTSLSQEGQKSLNSPPLSKALKTPSPGFVSKIPIPARLVKERSPSTSPTAVIGSKASFTEQNEHWRQYRPVSNPTTPVSSNEDSPSFIKTTPKDESASENLNQATTPDAKEKSSFSGENDHSEAQVVEAVEENAVHISEGGSSQSNPENTQTDDANLDTKGNLKVRFDDNSPEKIASYWDTIQPAIPNKATNTAPFYKSPLANTVNFDESTTENDDSTFMGEISYVSDTDDIRTYRPSFLDEASFMSEMDVTNASATTLDKEAAVQRFFAGVSQSEFTTFEDSRYGDFLESFSRADEQNNSLLNGKHSESSQNAAPEGIENFTENTATDKADTNIEHDSIATEESIVQPEASVSDDRSDVRLYSEVVSDVNENETAAGDHVETSSIEQNEQTVPVGIDSSEDAEQTVPEHQGGNDPLRRPNISYAEIVSHSTHDEPEHDEQQTTSAIESEPSNIDGSLDNSWPTKFPLPSTPFGQEASTQIENQSHGDIEYHSEITWNYNDTIDNSDSKHSVTNLSAQESSLSSVDENISNTVSLEVTDSTYTTQHDYQESEKSSVEHTHNVEDGDHQTEMPSSFHPDRSEENTRETMDDSPEGQQLDNESSEVEVKRFSSTRGNVSLTPSYSNVETPQKILKQLSSRQVSSAPPPAKVDSFDRNESVLPKSAKTVRELTPMRLLQSLSRMTTPSDTIKNLNDRFKESDISLTEYDDTFIHPESEAQPATPHIFNSINDGSVTADEELEQSQTYSNQDESSFLDMDDSQVERSGIEEYNPDQTFEESHLEEPSYGTEDYLYEDMVQAINNLKEIMNELRDGQDVHRNLGDALEANLNELNDKTQKRDGLLLEMKAMKDIVDQTNNEMSELKSQLEKRVRSEEEVDAKLADMTEVIDTLRKRIKNKSELVAHQPDNGSLGSFSSLMLNAFILTGVFIVFELLFIRVILRSNNQYDDVFGTMSHGTYYSRDQADHDQSWSVHLARGIWGILVKVLHGNPNGMSVPS